MNKAELIQLHQDTCKKCLDVMIKKNSDYTGGETSEDVFANFKVAQLLGIHPVHGLLLRVMDKIQRINSFVNDGELKVSDETVYDSFEDVLNYMILGKGMMMDEKPSKELNSFEEEFTPAKNALDESLENWKRAMPSFNDVNQGLGEISELTNKNPISAVKKSTKY